MKQWKHVCMCVCLCVRARVCVCVHGKMCTDNTLTNILGDDAESKTDLGHLSHCKREWVLLRSAAMNL